MFERDESDGNLRIVRIHRVLDTLGSPYWLSIWRTPLGPRSGGITMKSVQNYLKRLYMYHIGRKTQLFRTFWPLGGPPSYGHGYRHIYVFLLILYCIIIQTELPLIPIIYKILLPLPIRKYLKVLVFPKVLTWLSKYYCY